MDLITRAMFWRDTGCALDDARAAHDDLLSALMSLEADKETRAVVSGCGQERRYLCRRSYVSAIHPVRPICEPLPAADALAAAFTDARALMAAQTGCRDATLSPDSGGPDPGHGVTEVILDGCGQRFPVTCALTPALRHAAACEHQPPLPEAIAHGRAQAAQIYASAAACPEGAAPILTARPVEHLERGLWQLVWDASGCSGAAQLRCAAHQLRARQMSCWLLPQPTQEQLAQAALTAARRLRPGCTFKRAGWRDAIGLRSLLLAEGRCGEQRVELPLVCGYEPLIDRTRCDLDAAREALIHSSREAARRAFASEYSCAPAKINIVAESAQGASRRLELVGCKERASYVCVAGADGQPRCAPPRPLGVY
jgi:hypothetical protein